MTGRPIGLNRSDPRDPLDQSCSGSHTSAHLPCDEAKRGERVCAVDGWIHQGPACAGITRYNARRGEYERRSAPLVMAPAGTVSSRGTAWRSSPAATTPLERRRGLPGDPSDDQSRYLECAAHGLLVGCLYLPNGNPQPGPKFDDKLAWFERFIEHAAPLCNGQYPVVLAGDYNVIPTDLDIYDTKSWKKDALLQPESRECFARLLGQGWTDALRAVHPEQIFTFWDYFRQHWQRNSGLRIDHLLLNPHLAPRLVDAGVDRWVRDLEGASDHAPTWITLDMASTQPRPAKPAAPAPARKIAKKTAQAPAKAPATKTVKAVVRKTTGASPKKSASRKRT